MNTISQSRMQERGVIEARCKQHFKNRLYQRGGICISDYEYYQLCSIAARKTKHSRKLSRDNENRAVVKLSIRGAVLTTIYDFIEAISNGSLRPTP
jgi:hypothetical protein